MTLLNRLLAPFAVCLLVFGSPAPARADYSQRLSLGAGIVHFEDPSETDFEIGAEYESRMTKLFGVGALGNYVFSSPGIALIGVPEVFFHPFATDFFLSATPIIEFGDGTHVGARFGTRLEIPTGAITLVPTLAVDFIAGRTDYLIGIGLQF